MYHQPNNLDTAYGKLREWARTYPTDADLFSETDTRCKIIDTLLIDVLGWSETNIKREQRYIDVANKQKAIDYTLSKTRPQLIVEAKRHAVDFKIPTSPQVWYSLDGVIRTWPAAWSAIEQARAYADQEGAPYALATNGHQFILFRTTNEAGLWKRGSAFVVHSLQHLVEKCFTDFYKFVSFEHIDYDYFAAETLKATASRFRLRPRDAISGSNTGHRNNFSTEMSRSFGPILIDPSPKLVNFLQETYCTSEETLLGNTLLTNALLADPIPTFTSPVEMVRPGSKKDTFSKAISEPHPIGDSNPLIVLMGGTGVGKTTFLEWFFSVSIPEKELDNIIPVILDFRKKHLTPENTTEVGMKYATQQLTTAAKDYVSTFPQIKEIFLKQVKALTDGLLAPYASDSIELSKQLSHELRKLMDDGLEHFNAIVEYLHNRPKKKVVVVLDNVDQLQDQMQVQLYQLAQTIASSSLCITVIVLRESTYYRMLKTRQVDAYTNRNLHVRARPLSEVLQKRFAYMDKHMVNASRKFNAPHSAIHITDIGAFVRLLKNSLLSASSNESIITFLQSVSNGNLRLQLDMIFKFLTSGQTKMDEYALMSVANSSQTIPFHEFLHSVIHQDHRVYDESHSDYVMNVFEPGPEPQSSHFTSLRILHYLRSLGQTGELREQDYIRVSSLVEQFIPLGMTPDSLSWYIRRLKRFRLISDRSQDDFGSGAEEDFALTKSGWYYINRLHFDPTYVMAMCPDTAIFDQQTYERITSMLHADFSTPKIPISSRFKLGELFAKYLSLQEVEEHKSSALRNHIHFGKFLCGDAIKSSIDKVARSLFKQ